MKSFSIMQAQHNLSAVLAYVERGQTVAITRRKALVAKIVPVQPNVIEFPDFHSRAKEVWGSRMAGTDDLLDESRGSR